MNTIQVPHSSQGGAGGGTANGQGLVNLNISELYKQYAQKQFIGNEGSGVGSGGQGGGSSLQ